ncbi:hypothetical protein OH214_05730, partial [Idiomarina abyssalis]|uniref:hypothetical protein n=1 Tax=Idiomarina abyssalis TaxID=86102 RepID=UPI0023007F40
NSEVKHTSADGSVGSPHARVGHRQTINKIALSLRWGLFLCPSQNTSLQQRLRPKSNFPY